MEDLILVWWRRVAAVIVLTLMWAILSMPDGKLRVVFCDVGQGDASLIVKGSFQMLIDAGQSKGGVLACLSTHIPFWDRKIELVVGTHDQKDHIGALGDIERHYQIESLITSKPLPNNQIKQHIVGKGDRIRYGALVFDILWPPVLSEVERTSEGGPVDGDPNERAIVMLMKSPKLSVLYTSDIGEDQELALLDEGVLGVVDILKVAHHGSKYSSSSAFVERIRPKWAIVSVGAKNRYGHPAPEILKRFDILGSRILRTDKDGEIVFVVEGKKFGVNVYH